MTRTSDWLAQKIVEHGEGDFVVEDGPQDGVLLVQNLADGVSVTVACLDRSSHPFSPDELAALASDQPELGFVIGTKQSPIAHETYGYGDEIGVGVGPLGDLLYALRTDEPERAMTAERRFVESTLLSHRNVQAFHRIARRAYDVSLRRPSRSSRRVVIVQSYEMTAEEVVDALNDHQGLKIDTVASSNPAAAGFSRDAREAAERAGVHLVPWRNFLGSLNA